MADVPEAPSTSSREADLHAPEDQTATGTKAADTRSTKSALKAQKRLVSEFNDALSGIQAQQEHAMAQGGAAGELAKQRRRALREVLKAMADTSRPLEERMQLLQARFVAAMQEQQRHDKDVVDLQDQLKAAQQELEQGRTELGRVRTQMDSLQGLARTLTADNKGLRESLKAKAGAVDKVQDIVKDVGARMDLQQRETASVLALNAALQKENDLLRAQVTATSSLLEELKQDQEQRLKAIADKVKEQSDAMVHAQEAHTAMNSVLAENKVLALKVAAAEHVQGRVEDLEKLVRESQAQTERYKTRLQEMEGSIKAATSLTEMFHKMQKYSAQQQKANKQLLQDRELQQQQLQLLQQATHDQAEKLRRGALQRQRLEGLCRTLQARAGIGGVGGAGSRDAAAGQHDAEAVGGDNVGESGAEGGCAASSTSSGTSVEAAVDSSTVAAPLQGQATGCGDMEVAADCARRVTGGGDVASAAADAEPSCQQASV